jgi:histidine triad (HIT) family protein
VAFRTEHPERAACVFCSIVAGEAPAFVVLDDGVALGFLDVRPLFPGHVLLVPRAHVGTLADLPAADVGPYFERVQRTAAAVTDAMGAQGSFVALNNVVSQSVPHLHTHVVPRTKGDGLKGFFWPRTRYDDDAHADEVAARIAAAMERRP